MARKQTEVVKLQLRLLEALRRRLERAAADNQRSMNAEIIYRLEQSFRQQDINVVSKALEALRREEEQKRGYRTPDVTRDKLTPIHQPQKPEDKRDG